MSDLENLIVLIKYHLAYLSENDSLDTWIIKDSPIEGRGIFAKRDLASGDLIFVDHALISGPRISEEVPLGCAVCNCRKETLEPCACGLLVCSDKCKKNAKHKRECDLLCSWTKLEDVSSKDLSRYVVPFRSLVLEEAEKILLRQLMGHDSHTTEVKFMKKHFSISKDDEDLMTHACKALDANAYEMMKLNEDKEYVNLRGLFPVSALLNHTCCPNTRTSFDSDGRMFVKATAYIPEGTEIFTSYTGLLWPTPARRHHLRNTKHFLCECFRCCDRTEFGTNLAALKCLNRSCNGILLPMDPLIFKSSWMCENCHIEVMPQHVGSLQTALARLVSSASLTTADSINDFLVLHLTKFLPECNHIVMELKLRVIWSVGEAVGYTWKEVSARWLERVEQLCREALATCEVLRLGEAPLAARLHLRLHDCLLETLKRYNKESSDTQQELTNLREEVLNHLNRANDIFSGDILAPSDLQTRTKLANESLQSLIDYDNGLTQSSTS